MDEAVVTLRLYVATGSPNSRAALRNLNEIRQKYLPNDSELEVFDLFEDPLRALEDGVMMTPMLVLLSCDPPVRIVGDLSDAAPVLEALEVARDDCPE